MLQLSLLSPLYTPMNVYVLARFLCAYPSNHSLDIYHTKTFQSDLSNPTPQMWTRKNILYSNPVFSAHLSLSCPSPFHPLNPIIFPFSLIAKPSPSTTKPKLTKEVYMPIFYFKNTNTNNINDQACIF